MGRGSFILLVLSSALICACSLTRYVPEGGHLVLDHTVLIPEEDKETLEAQGLADLKEADSMDVCPKDRKAAQVDPSELEEVCRPKLNQKILGMRLKLRIHNSVDTTKMRVKQKMSDAKIDAKNARRKTKDSLTTIKRFQKVRKLSLYKIKDPFVIPAEDYYDTSVCQYMPSDTVSTRFHKKLWKYQKKVYRIADKQQRMQAKASMLVQALRQESSSKSLARKLDRQYARLSRINSKLFKACRRTAHKKAIFTTFEPKERDPKQYKSTIRKKMYEQWGEPPALLDTTLVEQSKSNILGYLRNRGYYDAKVTDSIFFGKKKPGTKYSSEQLMEFIYGHTLPASDTLLPADTSGIASASMIPDSSSKQGPNPFMDEGGKDDYVHDLSEKMCRIQYYVDPGECYFIKEIRLAELNQDPNIVLVASLKSDKVDPPSILGASDLYQGQPFDAELLDAERNRLAKKLDERYGYLGITPKHFSYLTDTNSNNYWVTLTLQLDSLEFKKEYVEGKEVTHKVPHTPHKVNRVYFHLNDSLSVFAYERKLLDEKDTLMKDVIMNDPNTMGFYPLDTIDVYNPKDSVLLYTVLYSGRPWVKHKLLNQQNFLVPSHEDFNKYRDDNYKRKYLERSYNRLVSLGTWSQVTPRLPFKERKVTKEEMKYQVYFGQMMDTLNAPRFEKVANWDSLIGMLSSHPTFAWLGEDTIRSFFRTSSILNEKRFFDKLSNQFTWEDTLMQCDPCQLEFYSGKKTRIKKSQMREFTLRSHLSDSIYAWQWHNHPQWEIIRRLESHPIFSRINRRDMLNFTSPLSLTDWKEFYAQKGLIWEDTLCEECTITAYDSVDVHYYLTPSKPRTLAFSPEATFDNGLFGVRVAFSYGDKNLFRGAERLSFNLHLGLETNNSLTANTSGFLNTFQIGPNLKFTMPYLWPLGRLNQKFSKRMYPETNINLGGSFQQRLEYSRWKANTDLTWKFRDGKTNTYEWTLLAADYNKIKITDEDFQITLDTTNDLSLQQRYTSNFRIGTPLAAGMKWTYDNSRISESGNLILNELKFKASGLTMWLLYRAFGVPFSPVTQDRLLGVPYAQFYAVENDFRYYWNFRSEQSLVARVALGAGVPYLNSQVLPFQVALSTGGSNTNRGFQSLSIGPGRYFNNTSIVTQQADTKLELNLEYRFPLIGYLKGALFADASNIWTWDEDSRGGQLTAQFWQELALTGGVGFRVDIDFIVIRLDLGIPLYIPGMPAGDGGWIFQAHPAYDAFVAEYNATQPNPTVNLPYGPRPHGVRFNFGIGYPF